MKTLYERLKEVEKLNEDVKDQYKIHSSALQKLQRELFLRYSEYNKMLSEAMSGEKSLEKTVEELEEPFRSYKIFLPLRKDEEHNKKIEELGQLTPYVGRLKKNGLFSLDNSVTNAGILLGFSFGVYYVSSYFPPQVNDPKIIIENFRMAQVLPSATILFFAPFAALIARSNRKEAIKNSREAAQYLDSKMKELFP